MCVCVLSVLLYSIHDLLFAVLKEHRLPDAHQVRRAGGLRERGRPAEEPELALRHLLPGVGRELGRGGRAAQELCGEAGGQGDLEGAQGADAGGLALYRRL